MSSLWGRLELKPEQEASEEFEENGKQLWSFLDNSWGKQELNKIRFHNHLLNNKVSLTYYNLQVKNEIKFLMEIFYSLYIHMALLPLTETCLSRALNVTCHLAEPVLLCWLKVMFNFHNLFINNQSVSQETNLRTAYPFFFFFLS